MWVHLPEVSPGPDGQLIIHYLTGVTIAIDGTKAKFVIQALRACPTVPNPVLESQSWLAKRSSN